jgi:hypothetical protein
MRLRILIQITKKIKIIKEFFCLANDLCCYGNISQQSDPFYYLLIIEVMLTYTHCIVSITCKRKASLFAACSLACCYKRPEIQLQLFLV